MKDQFRSVFDADYQGAGVFLDKVLKPLFGNKLEVLPVAENNPTDVSDEAMKKARIKKISRVANIAPTFNRKPMEVFDITLEDRVDITRARVGIQQIIRRGLFVQTHAFMLFHAEHPKGENWRFSYALKLGTIGSMTDAKRFTYLLGENMHCRTAIDRFFELTKGEITDQKILDAFNVEALSNEFFEEYRNKYAKFVWYITGKEFVKENGKWVEKTTGTPNKNLMRQFHNNDKAVRDYVKKMMGRITFLHFLQKKGWMNGDLNYMYNLFDRSNFQSNYLEAVLEPLFFGILNTKPKERTNLFKERGWNMSLLKEWKSFPYLNGGLFEEDEDDRLTVVFPKNYFINLFEFYSRFNFTVDENDPDDAEVGVDPEMLGKIFENLLEDNKDKGAFYTPKEIVRYMCQESLTAYLVGKTGYDEELIRAFVIHPYDEVERFDNQQQNAIYNALENVKICDPAIGSGAFPMGLLNELVRCEEALLGEREDDHQGRSGLKKYIIQNNIYGVDIEKGAIDIARLRFWLSIVVDEKEPSPLPNLDYKIMQGNSLLESYNGVDLSKLTGLDGGRDDMYSFNETTDELQEQLRSHLYKYYDCDDHNDKALLQAEIDRLIKEQIHLPYPHLDLSSVNVAANSDFFLWHTWFYDVFNRPSDCEKGFDIVIGNPPYFVYQEAHVGEIANIRRDGDYSVAFGGKLNAYKLFLANAFKKLICKNGLCSFIFQNSFLGDRQATNLRKYVLGNKTIINIDSFPERDNKKKRVFESVKMSVCIVLIRNTVPLPNYYFNVDVWDDKNKTSGLNTCFSLEEIAAIDNVDYTIPRIKPQYKKTIIKLLSHRDINIRCIEGELNVTFHKKFFTGNNLYPIILKGASIQKYYYTLQMSQGEIEYLDETRYMQEYGSTEKSKHHNTERIAMQGMTGANDKNRLFMTIVPKGYYLANSCNYIMPLSEISLKCLLAVLNSKIANWFFRCFSTNSNVNGYEVDNIPIPSITLEQQSHVDHIVDAIMLAKKRDFQADISALQNEIETIMQAVYGLDAEDIRIIYNDSL